MVNGPDLKSERAFAPCGFESCIFRQIFVRLAQMVERLPYKQNVGGSIPSPDTSHCPVNSEARVLPCPGRSRGFDSRTGRHSQMLRWRSR